MYGPGMFVGAGPDEASAGAAVLEELAVDVGLVALLLGFLEQIETAEAETAAPSPAPFVVPLQLPMATGTSRRWNAPMPAGAG